MEKYVQLCDTLNRQRKLIPYSDFLDEKKLWTYLGKAPGLDWYSSLFVYSKEAKSYFDSNNYSIAGYSGNAEANYLFFDLDNKKDLSEAQKDTRKLIRTLKDKLGISKITAHLNVYFSGNKGFHVHLHTKQSFTPEEMKHYCRLLAKDIPSFDGGIYDTARIIRIKDTRHQESKLYKIELDPKELVDLDVAKIRVLAKDNRKQCNRKVSRVDVGKYVISNKVVKALKSEVVVIDSEDVEGIRGLDTINFNKCPTDTPRCIYALLQGVMQAGIGERNNIFLHLGNFLRNRGEDKDHVLATLKIVAEKNGRLYPEEKPFTEGEIRATIISRVFRNGAFNRGGWGMDPEDPVFLRYCSAIDKVSRLKCSMHKKAETSSVIRIDQVSSFFEDFAENFDKNIVQTGIDFIDENMKITVGTMSLIVGAPGSGKTTLALNMLEKANALGIDCVFFSLDMHKNLIYLKLAQKLTDYKQDEIFRIFKEKDEVRKKEINEAIAKVYSRTFFDFTGALTMDDMKDRVLAIEEASGKKIKLVLVDYASRITGKFSDAYANAKHNALRSKDVADETNAAWLIICQVSRNTGDGATPLRTKRAAKDAGDWEEAATNVITCWRPFMGRDDKEFTLNIGKEDEETIVCKDNIIRLFLAKNRMGREVERPLHWDGAKGIVADMTQEEHQEYKEEWENNEDAIRGNPFARRN